MAILTPYKVNSYRRICDVCGRPRQIEDIRFTDNVAICRIHPQYRTAQQLNAINARVRPIRVLPVPQPKPLAPADTYTAEESQLFNLVVRTAPFDTVDVTANAGAVTGGRSAAALGWTLIYLTGLLAENKRPSPWLASARSVALTLGDLVIAEQANSLRRGAHLAGAVESTLNITFSHLFNALDTGLICAGLCRLYSITGTYKYLVAARSAAGFLTYLQSPDKNLVASTVTTAYGPPCTAWDDGGGEFSLGLYPGDLPCLWALSLLSALVGDVTIGLTAAVASVTSAATSRSISTASAQIRGFWTVGHGGVNGLSAETPFEYFDNSATAAWTGATFTAANWARAIYALAETDGLSGQVLSLWAYLQGFTGVDYDAKLAPATSLNGTTHEVASTFYDWAAAGLLAKVQAAQDRASIKTVKDTLAVPQPRFVEATPRSGDYLYLGPLGRSTFDLQPYTGANVRQQSVARAAQVALLYRQQPQGFTGRGH